MRWSQVKFIPDWNPGPSILIYKTKNSKIKGIFFFPVSLTSIHYKQEAALFAGFMMYTNYRSITNLL